MKQSVYIRIALTLGTAGMICFTSSPVSLMAGPASLQQKPQTQQVKVGSPEQAVAVFEERVKDYVKLRERIEEQMPNLSKEATPEEIQAHKTAFQEKVRAARADATPGNAFRQDIIDYIRTTIKTNFKGTRLRQLRETILEADTKGVPVRVNYPYPPAKELGEIPPSLLLKLPQLPKQVRYRFVGRHLLLVDRENGLIIDYMLDALP
jgi:hypothetical protein